MHYKMPLNSDVYRPPGHTFWRRANYRFYYKRSRQNGFAHKIINYFVPVTNIKEDPGGLKIFLKGMTAQYRNIAFQRCPPGCPGIHTNTIIDSIGTENILSMIQSTVCTAELLYSGLHSRWEQWK